MMLNHSNTQGGRIKNYRLFYLKKGRRAWQIKECFH